MEDHEFEPHSNWRYRETSCSRCGKTPAAHQRPAPRAALSEVFNAEWRANFIRETKAKMERTPYARVHPRD